MIIHGDCLEEMKSIPDGSIDMILSDLPYGTTACKWDTVIPFEPLWKEYKRIIKDNGAIVLTASQPFTSALVMSNPKMFKYEWIWEKEKGSGFARAKKQPLRKHEDILVFYNKQPYFDSIGKKLDKPYKHTLPINKSKSDNVSGSGLNENGERIYHYYTHSSKHTVLKIARDATRKSLHPTQKPVALFEYLIKTYTNEGDLVLDNAAGSGTTGVACQNLNRNFILIEKEIEYIDIINKRLGNPPT